MLRNYLKSAFRNLLRQRGYAFINIAGLTIGLACCMLIVQYVVFHSTFDAFNEKAGELYRIVQVESRSGEERASALVGHAAAPAYAEGVPEIVHYARIHPEYGGAIVSFDGDQASRAFKEERALYVDSTFLQMFSYPLSMGDPARVLRQPNTLVLTASAAAKYFGTEDPIGKTLRYTGWIEGEYTVTGVLEDIPPTSHLQFDFLLPVADLLGTEQYQAEGSAWGWTNFLAYLQLHPEANPDAVAPKLTEVLQRRQREDFEARGVTASVELQPLRDVHLDVETTAGAIRGTDPATVYFFAVVALITLVIALINYVNLATARAMDRAREVGVRKVVGAHRRQLMGQFLLESVLTNLAALVLALGLAASATPYVNRLAETELSTATWTHPWFFGIFGGVFLLGVLLSGIYPAFILSSFRPTSVLKGAAPLFGGRVAVRKALVVAQFAASIILLIGTGVVVSQVSYMRHQDIGLTLERVLVVTGPQVLDEGTDRTSALTTFAEEIGTLSAVSGYAFSSTVPGRGFNWYSQIQRATADRSTASDARATTIDHRFLDMYGVDLTAGRPFTEQMQASENGQPRPVLLNETAVSALNYANSDEAVGQLITMGGGDFLVQGVVDDFNWSSLHQRAEAVMLQYAPAGSSISFKVSGADLPRTIAEIRSQYEAIFPGNPFEFSFADAAFAQQYREDERFAQLFGVFAGFAILIACLGLLGLAAFTAESRTKEIGVRKVLGASVGGIVALLSRDFMALIGIAFVVAVPIAWYFMDRWLADFPYRIGLGPGVFLTAGAATVLVALLTVSYKSIQAATRDPVRSLRYE